MIRIFKFLKSFFARRLDDPVYYCDVYKTKGCAHVDGVLCDMETCEELAKFKNNETLCPVCGYYCLGNGGIGCIDKPKLTLKRWVKNINDSNI